MLELPQQGSSNEYPQSMFWSKTKKNKYTPAYPVTPVLLFLKVGIKGVFISRICFPDRDRVRNMFCPCLSESSLKLEQM